MWEDVSSLFPAAERLTPSPPPARGRSQPLPRLPLPTACQVSRPDLRPEPPAASSRLLPGRLHRRRRCGTSKPCTSACVPRPCPSLAPSPVCYPSLTPVRQASHRSRQSRCSAHNVCSRKHVLGHAHESEHESRWPCHTMRALKLGVQPTFPCTPESYTCTS